MTRTLRAAILALSFALALVNGVVAGQFENGSAALTRGDYPTAIRLLGPLADQGDPRAQATLAGIPGASNYSGTDRPLWASPFPLWATPNYGGSNRGGISFPWALLVTAAIVFVTVIFGLAYNAHQRVRRTSAIAKFLRNLPPEVLAEIEAARRVARERPWEPIAFGLDSVEIADSGFRFRATGVHRGRTFGFAIAFTIVNGPVAVCEWLPNGAVSEALLDILADYADVPRAESRFDDMVETSAIILGAVPPNVPFAKISQLAGKIFFENAEGQPEVYLNLDFVGKSGSLGEKDPMYRKDLVRASQGARSTGAKGGVRSRVREHEAERR
jgi:hypothetical protein